MGAPEQFAAEEVDERTDIFQLGALLTVMLTGKYPNQGGANLLVDRKDLPRKLTQAVQQALQPDPAQRFQSVADFQNTLQGRGTPAEPRPNSSSPRLSRLWEFQLGSPNWRTWSTPVSSSAVCSDTTSGAEGDALARPESFAAVETGSTPRLRRSDSTAPGPAIMKRLL